ncbi:MAG TPA: LacI family DNA-binding transcriptional regulator [Aggregatilinea sp.]|jgi:DNA-binding LacI/PurR family transcriptional regulator|uniref:LacI family DNA-binding transcriptional regulator n=1 Tax=Aggregatilinea sp. TaxID=2806333 RepID=UPI002CF3D51D|nr:LacI family DNA-binding transcriptional regulator [Aggregatilinea sp.]HML20889.1 LacI family DNA-binding transcriptional regulator [Aggregatilinea sp.]
MHDVAQKANVSINTVSLALQDSDLVQPRTKARVLSVAKELGYRPNVMAQNLRRGVVHTIGIMIPDVQNAHFWDIVDGAHDEAYQNNYGMVLTHTSLNQERESEFLRGLIERRYDGVILAQTYSEQSPIELRTLIQRGGAVVTLGRTWEGADRVEYFREDTAQVLLEYLYELGHRRIGFVMGVARKELAQERLVAYQHFIEKHDLISMLEYCGPSVDESAEATTRLLQYQPRPTAIISVNDQLATGIYRSLGLHGLRIPEDVSVAGFDNTSVAKSLYPSLTSVDVGGPDIGRISVQLLLQRLADPKRPQQIVQVPARLVPRESTAAPRVE